MTNPAFSYQELLDAGNTGLEKLEFLKASDATPLAYRRYVPASPSAALLFIHGGGAHSGAGYQTLATGIRERHNIAVYTPDLRGHGASDGRRGDAPSVERVWKDVSDFIQNIRRLHPGLPVVLGGHSSGGGPALNYATWVKGEPVDAYAFLAPEFGFRSGTERKGHLPFASANVPAFILNAMSGGLLLGHYYAVRFKLPKEVQAQDPLLLSAYAVNMANAVTPPAPQRQFAGLAHPYGLWIGEEDELLEQPQSLLGLALAGVGLGGLQQHGARVADQPLLAIELGDLRK